MMLQIKDRWVGIVQCVMLMRQRQRSNKGLKTR